MIFSSPLISARFLERRNGFWPKWNCRPNPGLGPCAQLRGADRLSRPRARDSPHPGRPPGAQDRLYLAVCRGPAGWICIDTLAPNRLVAEALAAGACRACRIRPVPGGSNPAPGQPPGFCRWNRTEPRFIEVKSVTWVEDGVALFPDGVTSRGRRHLEHLRELAGQGHEAWHVFVVQREDAQVLRAAAAIDPAYARELATAQAHGVNILVLQEKSPPRKLPLRPRSLLI